MKAKYMYLNIDEIKLDYENPRIAKALETYPKETLTSEQISLALGGGTDDPSGTSYSTLKESIRTNGGIINPIMVNKEEDGSYVVIEGNTRVQIYRELRRYNTKGNWDTIQALVFENLSTEEKDAIRLQSHLVGPREWDPYSKAKYLNLLSNTQRLPMSTIISYCGGKSNEIEKSIAAYQDMEEYYRPNLDGDDFNQKEFSKFLEMEKGSVKHAILSKGYTLEDYAKWVINGNIDTAVNVRLLPNILANEEATRVFLKENISEANKKLVGTNEFEKNLVNIPYYVLAEELSRRITHIEYLEVKALSNDPEKDAERNSLLKLYGDLETIINEIEKEG